MPILGVGLDEHTGLLETINAFHPVAPAWPSCPVSPSLLSSSCSGQAENDTPFSLSTLPLLPTLPSSSKFPSPLPPSLPQYPHGKFTLEVNPRAAPPFFLPLVLLWPCPAFLLLCVYLDACLCNMCVHKLAEVRETDTTGNQTWVLSKCSKYI